MLTHINQLDSSFTVSCLLASFFSVFFSHWWRCYWRMWGLLYEFVLLLVEFQLVYRNNQRET
jgi:hypothetical protein